MRLTLTCAVVLSLAASTAPSAAEPAAALDRPGPLEKKWEPLHELLVDAARGNDQHRFPEELPVEQARPELLVQTPRLLVERVELPAELAIDTDVARRLIADFIRGQLRQAGFEPGQAPEGEPVGR